MEVWERNFSNGINKWFKDRKIYMFDAFEDFQNERVYSETEDSWRNVIETIDEDFCNSERKNIFDDFKYPHHCIIKKGYFPDTAKDIEDIFCFVSIDIYSSTKSELEYFFPEVGQRSYYYGT